MNNLNNYQPNVIISNKADFNECNINNINNINNNFIIDKSNEILLENNDNNISNNNSDNNNSKKTNGASSININNSNNSVIHSPINCLNTITLNINNNNYNCFNNNFNENINQKSCVQFYSINGAIGLGGSNNRSVTNLNEFNNFDSRKKMLKKLNEQNNANIINENSSQKEINSLKNQNSSNIKRTALFKPKSKPKIKSTQYSNSTNTNVITNIHNIKI